MNSLEIKKSQLTNAGKGLFTKKDIKKGMKVAEYKGEKITWKEAKKRAQYNKDGYVFFISNKLCIDAYRAVRNYGRYANDAKGLSRIKGLKNNSVYNIEKDKVFIVATKNIPAGSEIFVDYGAEYWEAVYYNLKIEFENKRKKKMRSNDRIITIAF